MSIIYAILVRCRERLNPDCYNMPILRHIILFNILGKQFANNRKNSETVVQYALIFGTLEHIIHAFYLTKSAGGDYS